jgi:hypothetical protein
MNSNNFILRKMELSSLVTTSRIIVSQIVGLNNGPNDFDNIQCSFYKQKSSTTLSRLKMFLYK